MPLCASVGDGDLSGPQHKAAILSLQVISHVLLRMKIRYRHFKQNEVANRDRAPLNPFQCLIRCLCAVADPGLFLGWGALQRNGVTDWWSKHILKANSKKKAFDYAIT